MLSSSAQLAQYLTDFESDFISERYGNGGEHCERTVPAVPPPVVDTELEQELAHLEQLEELIATGQSTTATGEEEQENGWPNEQCLLAPSASSLSSTSSLEIEYGRRTSNGNPNPGGVVRNTITISNTNTTSKMAPPTSTSGQQRSVSFASPPTTSQIEADGRRTRAPGALASKKSPQTSSSLPSPTHNAYPQTKGLKVPTSSETPKAFLVESSRRSISPERPDSLECSYSLEEIGQEFDDEMATALAPGLVGYKALDADTLAGMEYIPTLKVSSFFYLTIKSCICNYCT